MIPILLNKSFFNYILNTIDTHEFCSLKSQEMIVTKLLFTYFKLNISDFACASPDLFYYYNSTSKYSKTHYES